VFVDSSALYAVISTRDQSHREARSILASLRLTATPLVLTNFIRAETHALLLGRLGNLIATRFLDELAASPQHTLVRVTETDEERAVAIVR
jgi:predicted nucleic acid-binding protein